MTKTPHDALFKSVFQQPENAAAELQHVLPAEHVAAIDWSTLKLEPGSYVDEALADQHSDLAVLGDRPGVGRTMQEFSLPELVPVAQGRTYTWQLSIPSVEIGFLALNNRDPYSGGRFETSEDQDAVFRVEVQPCD